MFKIFNRLRLREVSCLYSITWYVAVLVSFPESFLAMKLGYKLVNIDIENKKLALVSATYAVISFIVRGLPIPYGIHTVILIFSLIILGKVILEKKWIQSLVSVLAGMLIMGVMQSIFIPLTLMFLSKSTDQLFTEPWLGPVVFLPCVLLLVAFYMIIKEKKVFIYDLNEVDSHA